MSSPKMRGRRLRLRKKFRHYRKQERPHLSLDELLQYLRERHIRSSRVLERTRQPSDPNTNDFRKEFGSWAEAVHMAFGSELAVDMDKEYMVKAVWQLNLWTVEKFRAARKIDPVTIPSWFVVCKAFGGYRNLIETARRRHLESLLTEYRVLIRKLGRAPSLDEIKAANLRMDEAIQFYGGKKAMDEFVLSMKG